MARDTQYEEVDQTDADGTSRKHLSRSRQWAEAEVETAFSRNDYNAHLPRQVPETAEKEQPLSRTYEASLSQRGSHQAALSRWWLEAVAVVTAIGSLLSIIAALHVHENRPLPDWPYDISINSLISVFVVLMKGSMALVLTSGLGQLKYAWFIGKPRPLSDLAAYDEASRGPFGAVELLASSCRRHKLASLGALITLAAVLVDPFTQQILRYYSCPRTMRSGSPMLPRTQMFTEGQGFEGASPGLIAAMNTGLFYPGSYRYPFNCPSGNCTLPEVYHSIGFCYQCTDLHDQLRIQRSAPEPYTRSELLEGQYQNSSASASYAIYNYTRWTNTTLPSGLSAPWNPEAEGAPLLISKAAAGKDLTVEIILSAGASPSIGRQYGQFVGCPLDPPIGNWGCRGLGASLCTVRPCVRSYQGNIKYGNLTEKVVAQFDVWAETSISRPSEDDEDPVEDHYLTMVDMECLQTDSRSRVREMLPENTLKSPDGQWWGIRVAVDPETGAVAPDPSQKLDTELHHLIPKSCIYQINSTASNSILAYLGRYLDGKVSVQGTTIDSDTTDGTSVLQYFYNSGKITFDSVSSYFDSMTMAMTNYVRQNGNTTNSHPVLGNVLENNTCVEVRWPWIAYPATLVALILMFLVLLITQDTLQGRKTSIQTESIRNSQLTTMTDSNASPKHGKSLDDTQRGMAPHPFHDYKSSILPLLFHGFDQPTLRAVGNQGQSHKAAAIKEAAREIKVQMVLTDQGWKLAGSMEGKTGVRLKNDRGPRPSG